MKPKKLLSLLLSLALALSLIPTAAFAVETQTYQPGTYKAEADVKNSEDNDDEWEDYTFDVSVTVDEQGRISAVDCATDAVPTESTSYVKKAVNGTKKAVGVPAQIIADNSTAVDAVSGATYTSDAIIAAVNEALGSAVPAAVDKTRLQAKVDEVKALTEADYTADSWAALQTALKNAQDVLDNADAAQADVDAQLTALTAAVDALKKAETPVTPDPAPEEPDDGYTYLYAGLTWAEYWANENVYNATNTESRKDIDAHNETDLGGFDVVSRATTNHGLHRGSFQCNAVIEAEDGSTYAVSHWSADGATLYLTDGTSVGYSKGTITKADGTTTKLKDYKVYGLKYVPVAVKNENLEAFKAAYTTVENGGTLVGGYGENKLSAYTYTAAVDANTNGLKYAARSGSGFTFSAAKTGTSSGLAGVEIKTAEGVTPGINSKPGSFGEFLRVGINGNYGDLGASMQAVTWTYYGSDSSYSNALVTYGTKFAADNWMHKSMGIQLGLTQSDRCQLPAGTDGTGYWSLTLHALGYADYTYKFEVGSGDIAVQEPVTEQTKAELTAAIEKAQSLNSALYTAESWKNLETELGESLDMLEWTYLYESSASEQITHLTDAINNLKGAEGYVLMNIPYADFYAAEVQNEVKVDTVSSATLNKTRTGTLVGGSYHVNSGGTDITGITYPVKASDMSVLEGLTQVTDDSKVSIEVTNRGKTTTTDYTGRDALFESASYSYYILSEEPADYKELTKDENGFTFGAVQGGAQKLTDASAALSTTSKYGDYQINVTGIPETVSTVYAVVLNTQEGASYGLRHLENIWRVSELAFCTGFTTEVHGSPTSSAHYAAIMGQTIDRITYYTDQGVYTIDTKLYVPVKTNAAAEVSDGKAGSGAVPIEVDLPADFAAEYSVDGLKTAVNNGRLYYENAKPGQYTLTITDKSGKYAPISVSFVLSTDEAAAQFNGDNSAPALTPAEGVSEEDFAAYLKGITSVTVNGTAYAASGRGAVTIVKADGTIDLTAAVNGTAIFGQPGTYELKIAATGYPELTLTLTVADQNKGDDNKGDNGNTGNNDNNGNTGNNGSTGGSGNTGNNGSTSNNTNTGTGDNTGSVTKTSGTNDSNGTQKTDKVPGGVVKTADESHVFFFAGLLLLSGAVFTLILLKKRETR